MTGIIKKWCDYAQADLDVAKRLFDSEKPTSWTFLLALWHCHQAIEKILKMTMLKKEKEILKIHDLPRLAFLAEINLTEEDKTFLEDMNEYYLRSRYPDISYPSLPKPDKKLTKKLLTKTEKFFLWLLKQQ